MLSENIAVSILYAMSDAVIAADLHGKVLFNNPAAEKLTALSGSDISNIPLRELLRISNPDDDNSSREYLELNDFCFTVPVHGILTDKKGERKYIEICIDSFDGDTPETSLRIYKLREISPAGREIPDGKIYDEELLKKALDKAEESDKLKSAFLNQMSHEIRTPLNSILGFMSLMEEELINKGITDLAVYFDSVNRSSQRLQRTIEDILAMSGIQIGNYVIDVTRLSLTNILVPILKDYESLAKVKDIDIEFINNAPGCLINADAYTIVHSFQHLIDNAFKFTNKGKITVVINGSEKEITVRISDTGIGMSKEYMTKIFKPFSQEEIGYSRRYDGNGLGLAITKEFLRLNNAVISVSSRKGEGTDFYITFYLD